MNSSKNLKTFLLTALVLAAAIVSSINWFSDGIPRIWSETVRVSVASILLVILYIMIIFDITDRTLAALIVAAVGIAAHDFFLGYVGMKEIIHWVDLETLSLLLGMMIICNIISISGVFDLLAMYTYGAVQGRFWLLIGTMGSLVVVASAFADNVSTMLVLTPVLIKLCELENLEPRLVMIIMIVCSNIGGLATPVGDPPNLIIISDHLVKETLKISFGQFVLYSLPCVLITLLAIFVYLKLVYKSRKSFLNSKETRNNPLAIRASTACFRIGEESETTSTNEAAPGNQFSGIQFLDGKQNEPTGNREERGTNNYSLNNCQLFKKDNSFNERKSFSDDMFPVRRLSNLSEIILRIQPTRPTGFIRSKPILNRSLVVLCVTLLAFFTQSFINSHLTLGWASLFGGLTLLVWCSNLSIPLDEPAREESRVEVQGEEHESKSNVESNEKSIFQFSIETIDWETLIFFFALFVIMEIVEKFGLILFLGKSVNKLIISIPEGHLRSFGALSIVLWSSGIASAFIDNIPITSMMIKILSAIVAQEDFDNNSYNMKGLVFALAFGACLGGNGTLIGASANLVTANISSRLGYPISFRQFFNVACPITVLSLVVSNLYLFIVFAVLDL